MRKFRSEIPRTFRICLIVSAFLLAASIVACGLYGDLSMARDCGIVGGFCIAIYGLFVLWTARVIVGEKSHMISDDKERAGEAGERVARALQLGALVKTFLLALFLVVCIIVMKVDGVAAVIGVSTTYLPMGIVPLFVKSDPTAQASDGKEVEKQ